MRSLGNLADVSGSTYTQPEPTIYDLHKRVETLEKTVNTLLTEVSRLNAFIDGVDTQPKSKHAVPKKQTRKPQQPKPQQSGKPKPTMKPNGNGNGSISEVLSRQPSEIQQAVKDNTERVYQHICENPNQYTKSEMAPLLALPEKVTGYCLAVLLTDKKVVKTEHKKTETTQKRVVFRAK